MADEGWNPDRLRRVADAVFAALAGDEEATLGFAGEVTDFTRFSRSRVRQSGRAVQGTWDLRLVRGRRQVTASFGAGADAAADAARAVALLAGQRDLLPAMPEDPHLRLDAAPREETADRRAPSPAPGDGIDHLLTAAADLDVVGLWTAGDQVAGFASSRGHRLWHAASATECNWTVYHAADKAVKAVVGGRTIDPAELERQLARQRSELAILRRPPATVPPGEYRVYLGPRAVHELLHTLAYGAFSLKEQRSRRSSLQALAEGRSALAAAVTLGATRGDGLVPGFDDAGFPLPERVDLVAAGHHAGALVGSRSAAEFDLSVNAAWEHPAFLDLAAGELDAAGAAALVGDGLYVGDLWYLNLSDRNACRLTGMTRFLSCRVTAGEIVAPLAVMRFDDSIYRLLGEALVGLTRQRETLLIGSTYFARSLMGATVPGMLVEGLRLTL